MDIDPLADRLVIFDSKIDHEVMPWTGGARGKKRGGKRKRIKALWRKLLRKGPTAEQLAEGSVKPKVRKLGWMDWFLEKTPMGRSVMFSQAGKKVMKQTRGNYPAPEAILDCVKTGLESGHDRGVVRVVVHVQPQDRAAELAPSAAVVLAAEVHVHVRVGRVARPAGGR